MDRRSLLLFAVLLVAGCGAPARPAAAPSPSPSPSPSPAPIPSATPGGSCLTAAERAGVIRFPADNGASIAGVVLGRPGPVGVVLAHQSGGDLCQWAPYGRRLAGLGYTVLAIDLNGAGASAPSFGNPGDARYDRDVVAAAAQLRRRGVARLVLAGASIGGTAVVVAAAALTPAAAAVVDLSGPAALSGMDAVAAAPRVSAPLLIVSAADDPVTEETRAVAAAAHARLDIIPGTGSHGVALLDPAAEPKAAQVSALVEGFLRQYAG